MKRTCISILIGLSVAVSLTLLGCEGDKKIQPAAPISETPKTTPVQPAQPSVKPQPTPASPDYSHTSRRPGSTGGYRRPDQS